MVLRWRNYLLTRVAYSGSYYQGVGLSVLLPYEMLQVSKASGHFDFDAWWCITSTRETIIHVNLCMPCLHIQFPHKDHAKCFIWKQKQHRFLLVNPTMNNYVVELFVVVVVFFFPPLHKLLVKICICLMDIIQEWGASTVMYMKNMFQYTKTIIFWVKRLKYQQVLFELDCFHGALYCCARYSIVQYQDVIFKTYH